MRYEFPAFYLISMLHLAIINGPNLNLLGSREPGVYGSQGFDEYLALLQARFPAIDLQYYQSNVEGELINHLHSCMGKVQGVIFNPGAYTHTSIALADAVSAIDIPAVEVHISNVLAREDYRKTSFIAAKCKGTISGLGLEGYALAVQYFVDTLK